jgi:hypothetical protein
MTCTRLKQGLAAHRPMDELLEHVETCRDCQFYLENVYHARDLSVAAPPSLATRLGTSARSLSCEEALKVLAEEEFQTRGGAARHLEGCRPCRETAEAFHAFSEAARSVRMPARLRHRLEGVTEEKGVSIFGRILPYVAAFLLSVSLTLFFATKGNLSQEVLKLQETVYQTKGTAVSTYGRIVGFLARNLDKEDPKHEMRKSSGN